jgi:hypothetical protein
MNIDLHFIKNENPEVAQTLVGVGREIEQTEVCSTSFRTDFQAITFILCAVAASLPPVTSAVWNQGPSQSVEAVTAPLATVLVTNTNNSGAGSLRQAILDANASPGLDMIAFNIPGAGVRTITPTSALPMITDPVIIDGTTQPGFSDTPLIELDGTRAGPANGLTIIAGRNIVRGLLIHRFNGNGIELAMNGDTVIEGNIIGTDATGVMDLGNANAGVLVASGAGHVMSRNSIFANGSLGIDLVPEGVTPNDRLDRDMGANNLQNFPELSSAVARSRSVSITGMLQSTARTRFALEFFSNQACDPSGNGEGERFIGSTTVMTDQNGAASFVAAFPVQLPAGRFITATCLMMVRNSLSDTSEFSNCLPLVAGANRPPMAADDRATTDCFSNCQVIIDVLGNDSDPDRDPLTIVGVTQSMHGRVEIIEDGRKISYMPTEIFNGEDTFTYTISDVDGSMATAKVTITYAPGG